jgi:hypothetical protein
VPLPDLPKGPNADVRGTPPYLEGEQVHRYTGADQTVSQQLTFRDRGTQQGVYFYEARLQGELPLPSWIFFDPFTRTVTARPDGQVQPGIYIVRVVARDASGRQAVSTLTIHVLPENMRNQNTFGLNVRPAVAPLQERPALETPSQPPQLPQPAPVAPQTTPTEPQPNLTDPQSLVPTPQLPPTVPQTVPDNTQPTLQTPSLSPIDGPDNRRQSPQQRAENLSGEMTNPAAGLPTNEIAGLANIDGDKKCASLTNTLHGLGATGRMIEAARILESLAAENRMPS